jgi:type IV secretory pathway TrbF-like protein
MNRLSTKELFRARNGDGTPSLNPYLDARRVWNSHVDKAFSSLHVWQLIAVACLLIALASVGGLIYIGSQAKFVPYVIEVDKLGEAVAVGPAKIAGNADPRVVRASLASFISSARLVTPDQDLQRKAIFAVYGLLHTKDPATQKMNEYLNGTPDTSPFSRAARMTVNTEISTVLAITGSTWEVDWQETTRDRDGGLIGKPVSMRATLEIYIESPGTNSTQAEIQRNPIGIFIRNFDWQQR